MYYKDYFETNKEDGKKFGTSLTKSYLTKTNKNFIINPTTSEEIEDIKSSFQTGKVTDPSSISIKILKNLKKT